MDALTVLRREHTRIGQLFVEFDALSKCACSGRKALMREMDELVRRHIDMEEALIYQQLPNAPEWAADRVTPLHGEQEHHLVLRLLDEVAQTDCRSDMYIARVHVLSDVLLHHIKEEEAHIFPAYAGTHAA
ncbi:MAG TPA: hemerythrin domain-containing protein [Candidatus Baltobacteraceae bacterium]|nr:hemerythrin domain-containing protein [Candidatus Baltobacteraceae bacterium]